MPWSFIQNLLFLLSSASPSASSYSWMLAENASDAYWGSYIEPELHSCLAHISCSGRWFCPFLPMSLPVLLFPTELKGILPFPTCLLSLTPHKATWTNQVFRYWWGNHAVCAVWCNLCFSTVIVTRFPQTQCPLAKSGAIRGLPITCGYVAAIYSKIVKEAPEAESQT